MPSESIRFPNVTFEPHAVCTSREKLPPNKNAIQIMGKTTDHLFHSRAKINRKTERRVFRDIILVNVICHTVHERVLSYKLLAFTAVPARPAHRSSVNETTPVV